MNERSYLLPRLLEGAGRRHELGIAGGGVPRIRQPERDRRCQGFIERGESAKFADRTQLLELLEFCRNRENAVQALLVWKFDRLARNVGDHFNIKANLLKQNVRVVSVTEPIGANPEGKLLETILAGFAQFDNDLRACKSVAG